MYQKMIEKLDGCTSAGLKDLGGYNVGARFTVSNQPIWVLWNYSNLNSQVSLPIGPVSQVKTTVALPLSFSNTIATWSVATLPVTSGIATITVSSNPVYVQATAYINPDLDGDGIPNEEDADIDGDGMPNDFEEEHGLNIFVNDANEDADDDGASNLAEYLAGTDPQSDVSLFNIDPLSQTKAVPTIQWHSVSGRSYRVVWSPNLKTAWSNVQDGSIQATGSVMRWYDTGPPKTGPLTNAPLRFYRVRLE